VCSSLLLSKFALGSSEACSVRGCRLLNRFAQDTYAIDDQLPFMLNIFLAQSFSLLGTVVVLTLGSWKTATILLVVAVLYYHLQRYYRASSRELKRLDSVSRSPIFAHFSETLDGAMSIRAFDIGERFLARNLELLDENQRVSLLGTAASQWLTFRLQVCHADHPGRAR
jgi:ATP-binding cassette, subfamily C (CFTR/MRP), member 10